jgi:hypothetical protein
MARNFDGPDPARDSFAFDQKQCGDRESKTWIMANSILDSGSGLRNGPSEASQNQR